MGAGYQSSNSSSSSESWSKSLSEYFSNAISNNESYSQNSSTSGTVASELSNKQLEILNNRENQYNNVFFPELQAAIDETRPGSAANKALMEQHANAINTSYDAAQKATDQTLAQQGLSGSPTGVGAALKAANNRARSSSLAQAYFNQLSNAQQNKNALLGMMGSMMTTPTNSAEYYSQSQSQGTSQSTGQSVSESGGQSTSQSQSTSKSKGSGSGWNFI